MSTTRQFFKYVIQNIFGMLGTSCYIIVDTFFIAKAAGADGITVLNLVLPFYSVIFAIGAMVGVGSATRFAILRAQGETSAEKYFFNALSSVCIISIPFVLAGIFIPDKIIALMGGDPQIVALGIDYTRIFLLFTPFFMMNHVIAAFVRNDNAPSLAMAATLAGSLFNVVFDYIFMFPIGIWACGRGACDSSIADCQHFNLRHTFFAQEQYGKSENLCAVSEASVAFLSAWRICLCGRDFLRRDHCDL